MAGRDPASGAQHDSTNATTLDGTPRSTSAATDGRPLPSTCRRSASTFCGTVAVDIIVSIISASNGTRPVSTCHASTPKLCTSLAVVIQVVGSNSRGSMYNTVPRSPIRDSRVLEPTRHITLLPKSTSLAEGNGDCGVTAVSSTLSGFTSPWMMSREGGYPSPPATSASSASRSSISAS